MRKAPLSLLLLIVFAASSAARAQSLLPERFGSWAKRSCEAKPAAYLLATEAGDTQGASSCRYALGERSVTVWAEKFHDPTSAYEVYTSTLRPGMIPSLVASNSALDRDVLRVLTGNVLVEIHSQQLVSEGDLRLLVKSMQGHAEQTPLPPIRSYLPVDGMVQGSQRYALGPAGFEAAVKSLGREKFAALVPELEFSARAEAMLAQYFMGRGHTEVVLLVEYPTPQLAEKQLKHLQPFLAANPDFASTVVERKASLLSFVLAPESPKAAASLRDAVNYETNVTWNEASQTLTDPPWLVTIKNIFVGTFVFCGLAIFSGILYGGVRVFVKRYWPGKVFDRPEDMEVLQLGLNSKRIDPRDFY